MDSESYRCEVKIPIRRTVQIKAPIAAKTQSIRCAHGANLSQSISKIGNDELDGSAPRGFNEQMLNHELVIGSIYR